MWKGGFRAEVRAAAQEQDRGGKRPQYAAAPAFLFACWMSALVPSLQARGSERQTRHEPIRRFSGERIQRGHPGLSSFGDYRAGTLYFSGVALKQSHASCSTLKPAERFSS